MYHKKIMQNSQSILDNDYFRRVTFKYFSYICYVLLIFFIFSNLINGLYTSVIINLFFALSFFSMYKKWRKSTDSNTYAIVLIITASLVVFSHTIITNSGSLHNFLFLPAISIFIFGVSDNSKVYNFLVIYLLLITVLAHYLSTNEIFYLQHIPPEAEINFVLFTTIGSIIGSFYIGKSFFSERQYAFKQLDETKKELQSLSTKYEDLLCLMIHDLSTPTMIIENLSKDSHKDSLQKVQIKKISETIDSVRHLYLNWSKSETPKLSKLDINFCVNESVNYYKQILKPSSQNINFELNLEDNIFAYSHKNILINNILGNLISNCVKFSENDSTIYINTATYNEETIIQISDQGEGISNSVIANIENNKPSAPKTSNSGDKGLGLGLLIVKHFVEGFDGRFKINRGKDKGTIFEVRLKSKI